MIKCLALALLLVSAIGVLAADGLSEREERRAQRLGGKLRCVVCSGETVQESPAGLAADMRRLIRSKIKSGESDEQILGWLRGRYGDAILIKPPLAARTYALWSLPFLFLLAGWLLMRRLLRK